MPNGILSGRDQVRVGSEEQTNKGLFCFTAFQIGMFPERSPCTMWKTLPIYMFKGPSKTNFTNSRFSLTHISRPIFRNFLRSSVGASWLLSISGH